ncbi:MAG TPA: diguanylate cyclase [Mycobacteriales bacterium]|nr:diguanylate cyclase [Mycobacteriales bacterium]
MGWQDAPPVPGRLPPTWSVAAAVVAGVALLYAWPLVDAAGAGRGDGVLRLVAALAASLAAAHAAMGASGAARAAWLSVVGATQLVAGAEAGGLLALHGAAQPLPAPVAPAAQVLLAGALGVTVFVLGVRPSGASLRRAVEAAVLGTGGVLLLWAAAQFTGFGAGPLLAVRLPVDALLLGVSALALVVAAGRRAVTFPLLGGGGLLVSLAGLLGALAGSPARLQGVAWTAGVGLVALAAVVGPAAPTDDDPSGDRPRWLLPSVLLLAVPLGTASAAARPDEVVAPAAAIAVTVLILVLMLLRSQLLLAERRDEAHAFAEERARLEHRAFHDELTGLANRALFTDRLEHALALHRRHSRPLTVLFCDLDDFKDVNDQHGHDVGDEVLRTVAERMRSCMRPTDTLARLSGDEFAVLLEDDVDADVVVGRLHAVVGEPLAVGGVVLAVGVSIGAAHLGGAEPTPTAEALLRTADERMFARKRSRGRRGPSGGGAEPSLREALPGALERGEVTVVYQPLIDPGSGQVVGLEALARWRLAGTQVPPPAFVEMARELGLLSRLTALVADRACEQLRRWCDAVGHQRLTVAVNIEPEQLADSALHAELQALQARHGLRPGQLVLELPATCVGADVELAARTSRELVALGTPLSLSGMQESGLGLMHRLSLASVKVGERTIHLEDGVDRHDRMLRALKGVGRELDVGVVVEGIDRQDELAAVRSVGGLLVQGFLLARPAPPGDLDELIRTGLPPRDDVGAAR